MGKLSDNKTKMIRNDIVILDIILLGWNGLGVEEYINCISILFNRDIKCTTANNAF